jgi:hypothetical protein
MRVSKGRMFLALIIVTVYYMGIRSCGAIAMSSSQPHAIGSQHINKLLSVLDSPSLVQMYMDPSHQSKNVFDSPSCILAGGTRNASVNIRASPSVTILNREGTDGFNALLSPSVIFQGLSEKSIRNSMSSPSIQTTAESRTKYDLPLPLITGHPLIKTALLAVAVNPTIGGLVIEGGRGTGKSVLVRALHRILPSIQVIDGSAYNVAPHSSTSQIDDFLKQELILNKTGIENMSTVMVTCPFVQVPLNIMEDRLFGAVDIKRTLEEGTAIFTPGLLATCNRGILQSDVRL